MAKVGLEPGSAHHGSLVCDTLIPYAGSLPPAILVVF